MEEIVTALSEQHAELAGILEGLDEDDWQRPTPSCEGWTVLDVVLHLAQTDEVAIESARDSFGSELAGMFADGGSAVNVDEAADVMVVAERDTSGADLFVRWKTASDTLREVLATARPVLAQAVGRRRPVGPHARDDPPVRVLDPHPRRRRSARHRARTARSPLAHRPARVAHGPLRVRALRPRRTGSGRVRAALAERRDVGVRAPGAPGDRDPRRRDRALSRRGAAGRPGGHRSRRRRTGRATRCSSSSAPTPETPAGSGAGEHDRLVDAAVR